MNAAERRIAQYVEQAHQDNIERLIDAWADLQTERLVREIVDRPVPFLRVA